LLFLGSVNSAKLFLLAWSGPLARGAGERKGRLASGGGPDAYRSSALMTCWISMVRGSTA